MTRLSLPARAMAAGAICLAVLGAMSVLHAWPLWTGQDILMSATIGPGRHRSASGEYLTLSTRADLLRTGPTADDPKLEWAVVRPAQPWIEPGSYHRELRGRTIYVQLEPGPEGNHAPVSVSLRPVAGAVNLRGTCIRTKDEGMRISYGLNAFFLEQDRIAEVRSGGTAKRKIQLRVAIASSGRARIRELLVDGVPVR